MRSIFSALWRGKKTIFFLVLAAAVLSYLLVSQIPPGYTARASVMLEQRKVQVLASDNVVSDLNLNNALLDTQAAVIRSNLLLERVISSFPPDRLEGFDPANRAPNWRDKATDQIKLATDWVVGQLEMAPEAVDEPSVELLTPEQRRMRRLIGELRRSMLVWREGQSYVIAVSVETPDAELSMMFANGIANEYINTQVSQLTSTVRGATAQLTERVDLMRGVVETAEAAVEDYRVNQLALGGVSADSLSQQLIELSTQIAVARADLASVEARYQQIQSVIDSRGFEAAAELLSSPFVLSLREQKSALEREDSDQSTQLGPEHPSRQSIRASVAQISAELTGEVIKIVASLENDVEIARIRALSLESSLANMEERAADMSRTSLDLRQLEREADAARDSYEATLARLNETRSIEELQRPDAQIVERAVIPGGPSSPRVTLFTTLGAVSGLSLGLIAVFYSSVSGQGFVSSQQLHELTGEEVIVSLPKERWRSVVGMAKALRKHPYQAFGEALRQLRNAVTFRSDQESARSIMIASSLPNEGKTSTSIALASIEALAERSAILVDFDIRRSELARILSYKSSNGDLRDYLIGRCELKDATLRHADYGFDVLSLNEPRPHLFDEVSMAQILILVENLKTEYDLVIIDTPPLLLVADTLQLARIADATVLLVRQGDTARPAVLEAIKRLKRSGLRNLYLGLSFVDDRDSEYSYGKNSRH